MSSCIEGGVQRERLLLCGTPYSIPVNRFKHSPFSEPFRTTTIRKHLLCWKTLPRLTKLQTLTLLHIAYFFSWAWLGHEQRGDSYKARHYAVFYAIALAQPYLMWVEDLFQWQCSEVVTLCDPFLLLHSHEELIADGGTHLSFGLDTVWISMGL